MTKAFSNRLLAAAICALAVSGAATVAQADVLFHNVTDQTLHFSMTCNGTGQDDYTIDPHSSGSLYCKNGSDAAVVTIRTDHGGYDEVVRAVVYDGSSYRLGYDGQGDVSLAPGA